MLDSTNDRAARLRLAFASLHDAIDALEAALLDSPTANTIADIEVTPELQEVLERVPDDEIERLSGVLPHLTEPEADPKR